MRRRRITAAAVVVAGLTLLAACAGGTTAPGGPTTITFWTHTHPPMIEVYQKLITEYEAEHPGIKIDYQTIPNNEFGTKMLTSLSNGTGPDVINMDDSALRGEYITKNLVAPIDPAALGVGSVDELKSRYVPGTLDGAAGPDGQLYGLPSEFNGTALAINTEHFADAGLDPDAPPATWDDVADAGQKLIAAGHTQAFSFLYLHSGWYTQQFQTLLGQTGGVIADGDHGALDQPAAKRALQTWVDLAGGSRSTADPNKTSREATVPFQDLATGRQSMAIVYPWAMDQIAETNPEVYRQLKVVPLPQLDAAAPANRVYGYYWAVNRASKQQQAAWAFIDFLAGRSDDFLTGTNFVQPVVGWDQTPAARKIAFIDVWSAAYPTGRFDQVTPHYSEVQDALTAMINGAVFDHVPVDQAAAEATEAVTRILQN